MRNLIIFDLDGTLAHTAPDLLGTLNRITAPEGLEPIALEQVGQIVGHGAKAMIRAAFALNEKTLEEVHLEELFQAFLEDYGRNLAKDTHLFEGVISALDILETKGHFFAVCTNKMHAMAVPLLDQLGVLHRFKSVTGGDSFDFRKPDARHLKETCKLAGFSLSDAIMIGDSETDINAAKNAKIPSVAVTFGYTQLPVKELGANEFINHFDQLPDVISRLRTLTS